MKNFTKNDEGFVCAHCGKVVKPLGYTSRNHCPYCLYSLHVDINPGDRQNTCKGLQQPINFTENSKKGYIITYKCTKCGAITQNKAASDDNFDEMLKIQKDYSNYAK
ncbi:MAG: RNHCP domain-containing protein [Clostridia bacterium]|nr:RNHCP domain-containing protein [Clostridia bacterium]